MWVSEGQVLFWQSWSLYGEQIEMKRDGVLDLVEDLTSDVEVGRSGVACSCAVHCHTLVLALVRLLAVLDLQRPCKHNISNHKPDRNALFLTHSQTIETPIALNEGGPRKRKFYLNNTYTLHWLTLGWHMTFLISLNTERKEQHLSIHNSINLKRVIYSFWQVKKPAGYASYNRHCT